MEVGIQQFLPFGILNVYYRHIHHIVGVGSHFFGNLLERALSLYENLVCYAQVFGDFEHQVIEPVTLVYVYANVVFANFKRLAERRDMKSVDSCSVAFDQTEFLKFPVGVVANLAVTVGAAVYRAVVGKHDYAVFCHFKVKFHNVGPHLDK